MNPDESRFGDGSWKAANWTECRLIHRLRAHIRLAGRLRDLPPEHAGGGETLLAFRHEVQRDEHKLGEPLRNNATRVPGERRLYREGAKAVAVDLVGGIRREG